MGKILAKVGTERNPAAEPTPELELELVMVMQVVIILQSLVMVQKGTQQQRQPLVIEC